MNNRETNIIFITPEAREILRSRGVTFDASDTAVEPKTAAERLAAFLKNRPTKFRSVEEMRASTRQENGLRNAAAAEFYARSR
jgi:hypothetical protein